MTPFALAGRQEQPHGVAAPQHRVIRVPPSRGFHGIKTSLRTGIYSMVPLIPVPLPLGSDRGGCVPLTSRPTGADCGSWSLPERFLSVEDGSHPLVNLQFSTIFDFFRRFPTTIAKLEADGRHSMRGSSSPSAVFPCFWGRRNPFPASRTDQLPVGRRP